MEKWKELKKKYEQSLDEQTKKIFGITYREFQKEMISKILSETPEEERIKAKESMHNPKDVTYDEQDISDWITSGVSHSVNHLEHNRDFCSDMLSEFDYYQKGYDY